MKDFVCLYCIDYIHVDGDVRTECGLLYADNFVDAVTQLEQRIYGEDLVKINEIELYDTTAVFSKDTYALIKKELSEV